jgi:L-ascorbate metabolism protein UlaG (beta-lactamase superfamily)
VFSGLATQAQVKRGDTTLRWLGQSCFLITSKTGLSILTDPYAPQTGYAPLKPRADSPAIVTVSHEHADHNATNEVPGKFEVVRGAGAKTIKGIAITGIAASHGVSPEGQSRGADTIFVLQVDGLRICHLGDLGTLLSAGQLKQIGRVDVLMIPVGGYYTIDAAKAWKVIAQLKPRIVLPMHYKTPASKVDVLSGIGPFIKGQRNLVRQKGALTLTPQNLPKETTVYALPYE